ncbi:MULTISPECIES: hypothetical protein [Cytobacillus]|uniref:hypothetical protein n=1 Tax=Cytobacillus TaxID=2675230 RepID=UPI002041CDCD|nr:hypothetical protein [Cytobacillus firmus]MCM3708278.1 hypothetical protein [Cytobacillus firmus]
MQKVQSNLQIAKQNEGKNTVKHLKVHWIIIFLGSTDTNGMEDKTNSQVNIKIDA